MEYDLRAKQMAEVEELEETGGKESGGLVDLISSQSVERKCDG
jgi:hypothetical protein